MSQITFSLQQKTRTFCWQKQQTPDLLRVRLGQISFLLSSLDLPLSVIQPVVISSICQERVCLNMTRCFCMTARPFTQRSYHLVKVSFFFIFFASDLLSSMCQVYSRACMVWGNQLEWWHGLGLSVWGMVLVYQLEGWHDLGLSVGGRTWSWFISWRDGLSLSVGGMTWSWFISWRDDMVLVHQLEGWSWFISWRDDMILVYQLEGWHGLGLSVGGMVLVH